jgi:hypothetical protein
LPHKTDQIIQGAQGDFLFSALITKRGFGVLSEFDT